MDLLGEGDITLENGILAIRHQNACIKIDVSGLNPDTKIRVMGRVASWNVDIRTGKMRIGTLDLRKTRSPFNTVDYLNRMTARQLTEKLVRLVDGRLPVPPLTGATEQEWRLYRADLETAEKQATHTAYDTQRGHLIGLGLEKPNLQYGSHLVGVTEKHAFFFNQDLQLLWKTDLVLNQAIASYQLRFATANSRITGVFCVQDRTLVEQVVPLNSGEVVKLIHVLEADQIQLVGVQGLSQERLQRFVKFSKGLSRDLDKVYREGSPADRRMNLLEVFAEHLSLGETEESGNDLPVVGEATLSDWVRLQGMNQEEKVVFVNLGNGYAVDPKLGDALVIKSWNYLPMIGGMGLILWSPQKKTAQFLKLKPTYFNSHFIQMSQFRDAKETDRFFFGQGAILSKHDLAAGQKVTPFQEWDQVYLVAEDGETVICVDSYGSQTSLQYQIKKVESETEDAGPVVLNS